MPARKPRKPKNPLYIAWKNSLPKAIIIEDLISGLLPLEQSEATAEEAWEYYYQHMAEFNKVVFSQFEARLKEHRKQVKGDLGRALKDARAMEHDRRLFPRQLTNQKGELVFDLHPAKDLLREDIEQKLHEQYTPMQLYMKRTEYQEFGEDIFRQRIYQEIRRKKFVNFLNEKRKNGKLMRCKPPVLECEEDEE